METVENGETMQLTCNECLRPVTAPISVIQHWHAQWLLRRSREIQRFHEIPEIAEMIPETFVPPISDLDGIQSFVAMDVDKKLRFFHKTCTDRHKVETILEQITGGIPLTGELT